MSKNNMTEEAGCAWMIIAFFIGVALCIYASKQ